jgi:hypothetical protein
LEKFKILCLSLTLLAIELANASEQRHSSASASESSTNPIMKEQAGREKYTIPVTLGIAGIIAAQPEMESLVVVYPDGKKQETNLQNGQWRNNRFNLQSVDVSSLSSKKFSIYYTSPYVNDTPISLTECVFQPAIDVTKRITKIRIHVTSKITHGVNATEHSCIAELGY